MRTGAVHRRTSVHLIGLRRSSLPDRREVIASNQLPSRVLLIQCKCAACGHSEEEVQIVAVSGSPPRDRPTIVADRLSGQAP